MFLFLPEMKTPMSLSLMDRVKVSMQNLRLSSVAAAYHCRLYAIIMIMVMTTMTMMLILAAFILCGDR